MKSASVYGSRSICSIGCCILSRSRGTCQRSPTPGPRTRNPTTAAGAPTSWAPWRAPVRGLSRGDRGRKPRCGGGHGLSARGVHESGGADLMSDILIKLRASRTSVSVEGSEVHLRWRRDEPPRRERVLPLPEKPSAKRKFCRPGGGRDQPWRRGPRSQAHTTGVRTRRWGPMDIPCLKASGAGAQYRQRHAP